MPTIHPSHSFGFVRRAAAAALVAFLAAIAFAPQTGAVSTSIVISQIYGGGGNSGATLKNDFIELYNRGTTPVSLSGWSVQYASSAGTSWQVTPLTAVTVQPGQYYLVQEAVGAGGTVNLPTPDAIGTIAMSATSGKVALVSSASALAGACPAGVIDFVGYGGSANCAEGSALTPNLSNTTAAQRKSGGAQDTDDNAADFSIGAPAPRNTGSDPFVPPPPPIPLRINEIQGSGSASPYAGKNVSTFGIVTGVKTNGFFIQTQPADDDGDPATSEGVFVFTSSAPPAAAAVGNLVNVVGAVQEFKPASDPNSPPATEIAGGPTVTLAGSGYPLPSPVALTAADTPPTASVDVLERFEGMRVSIASLIVVAPTSGTINEANATSTTNGVFYGVITGIDRPFREPGVQVPDPLPAGAPAGVPRYDADPERIRVDSDGLVGATPIDVTTGAIVTNLVGPLDYGFRTYTVLPDPASPPTATGNITAIPVDAATNRELMIASFNMERFYDTVNDPATSDVALTAAAFERRLAKASLAIRDVMRMPDVIGVEEMENLATLQTLAARISADAVAAGEPDPQYQAILEEGNDIGGIDVGFLAKRTVTVADWQQLGLTTTYTNPLNGQPELLNDRPSLLMHATVTLPGAVPFPVTVIVNHLRSLSGVDDPADGPRVRAKRQAQAEFLANAVQEIQAASPSERIVLVGDFNAFQFNDGYVDVMGTIRGTPTPPGDVVLASPDLVNPDLVDLVDTVPAPNRYSYVFDGTAQELDHVLVTGNLVSTVTRFEYARNDADFPEIYRSDATRPERISDHDMVVAYFATPLVSSLTYTGDTTVEVGSDLHASVAVTGPATGVVTFTIDSNPPRTAVGTIVNGAAAAAFPGLPIGHYTVTATFGGDAVYAPSTTSAAVDVVDTTPPTILTVAPSVDAIWPPDKRMTPVTLAVTATDAGDSHVDCRVASVTNNETGTRDWLTIDTLTISVKADRNGNGSGRVYTITIACVDDSHNESTATAIVTVPHDQR